MSVYTIKWTIVIDLKWAKVANKRSHHKAIKNDINVEKAQMRKFFDLVASLIAHGTILAPVFFQGWIEVWCVLFVKKSFATQSQKRHWMTSFVLFWNTHQTLRQWEYVFEVFYFWKFVKNWKNWKNKQTKMCVISSVSFFILSLKTIG